MKKAARYLRFLIITLSVLVVIAGGGGYLLGLVLHLDSYKDEILNQLQKSLNRPVTYDKGTYSLSPLGPSFTFTKISVREKDGKARFINAESITFRLALLPLLQKRVELKEMTLDRPVISLYRDSTGAFNISDLLAKKKEEIPLQVTSIRIKRGTLLFNDFAASAEGSHFSVTDAELFLSQLARGKTCSFKISGSLPEDKGSVNLAGSIKIASPAIPLTESIVDATIHLKNLNAERYWPYYSRYVPFRKITGFLDMNSSFKGKLTEFASKGNMKVATLRFDYPQVFHSVLTPRDLHFGYQIELNSRDIVVKTLDLTVDGLRVKGSCSILDIPSRDPRIVAQAVTSTFRLQDFRQYIPYGIIVKDPADFIEQHIYGGSYKLDYGSLDGRASQIAHMERGENYNVLAIRGRVEDGLVTYGPQVPTFNGIKGELEIKGKDFLLHRMTGRFGGSPFSLEGKIADYPLDKSSSYPFQMTMIPGQKEITWLLGKDAGKRLLFAGESRLRLTGDGPTSNYVLSGDWGLTNASYSYPGFINKPAGRKNSLSFKGSLNKQQANLESLQYDLAPLVLTTSGKSRFGEKKDFSINIKTNKFQISDLAQLLPAVTKYTPAGNLQATVYGESPTGKVEDLQWRGKTVLSGCSFKPFEQMRPVSNINGSVSFNGTTVETSQLVVRIGNSTIYCQGSLDGFKNPTANLAFSAPSLDMADLGLRSPLHEVKAIRVVGNLALKNQNLAVRSLTGQIGNTLASIKGNVLDINNPRIDIVVNSPHLELDDVLLVTGLERSGKKEGESHLSVRAAIHATSGKVKEVDFEGLTTDLTFETGILYLQKVDLSAFDGHVSGSGRVDFGFNDSPPRYQFSFDTENLSADRFAQAFGIKRQEVRGTLSLKGELTARGRTGAELKKTALGAVKLRCEAGSLKKFAILSKIFSILNVSQLFKLRLPEMIAGGMPFNTMTATFSVQDGMASTQDFFIASNAMNISAVGKVDLVKSEIDATIGVQPLQTVDKVVNRIPVVGWILTGGKKTFITTYFMAKGNLEDPVVKAIPVRSMAKGVFNIFKRVFELPGKLITDTGEVLLGK